MSMTLMGLSKPPRSGKSLLKLAALLALPYGDMCSNVYIYVAHMNQANIVISCLTA